MIKTERLILRMPNEVTAKEVCNYYIENRKFLEEFEPVRDDAYYTEEYQDRVLAIQTKDFEEKRSCRFYISESNSPEHVIGFIALNNIVMGAFCSCFLGYGLDLEHRNNGYMTEATNRIVEYAFNDLGLHRIEGNVIPRNKASIAVALKCGFEYEGLSKKYLKINGVWEDHAHYVRLNESMEEAEKELVLVEPTIEYADQIMEYRKEFMDNSDSMDGTSGLVRYDNVQEWLEWVAATKNKETCPQNWVPDEQYLCIRKPDNRLVGMIDVRLDMNDEIYKYHGSIGYSIRRSERKKGYAKKQLQLALNLCKEKQMSKILITCKKDNIASAKTIIRNGGILENEICNPETNEVMERYWISLYL